MAQGNVLEVQSCNALLVIVYFPGKVSSFFPFSGSASRPCFQRADGQIW